MPAGVLTWEAGIREGRSTLWQPRYDWHNFAVVVMFAVLGVASIVLGAHRGFALRPALVSVVAAGEIALLAALMSLVMYQHRDRAAKRTRRAVTGASPMTADGRVGRRAGEGPRAHDRGVC